MSREGKESINNASGEHTVEGVNRPLLRVDVVV